MRVFDYVVRDCGGRVKTIHSLDNYCCSQSIHSLDLVVCCCLLVGWLVGWLVVAVVVVVVVAVLVAAVVTVVVNLSLSV